LITSDLPIEAWSPTAIAELRGLGALLLYSGVGVGVEGWRCGSTGAGGMLPDWGDGFHIFN
jgi:hypothetical protein